MFVILVCIVCSCRMSGWLVCIGRFIRILCCMWLLLSGVVSGCLW